MKKLFAVLLAGCMILCTAACGKSPDNTPADVPAKTPMHRLGPVYMPEAFAHYLEYFGKTEASGEKLDVPVYYEAELLYQADNLFYLGRDATRYVPANPSAYENLYALRFLRELPTVLRVRAGGSSYAVYDTDTGYRAYVFIEDRFITGYPVVINKNKILSYKDFSDIQVGDSIEKVETIDDVATLYKKTCAQPTASTEFTSLHYLTDGILKIQYLVTVVSAAKEAQITVSNVVFYEDYAIPTADGKITSHKLCDIDLPDGTSVDTPAKTPLHRVGPFYEPEAFARYLKHHGVSEDPGEVLDIPVYYEEELLFHPDNGFILTRDASAGDSDIYALNVLYDLPAQLRVRSDGSSYAVFDTDTGYRLYLFFCQANGHLAGYPIVINKNRELLSLEDFEDIKVGDPIAKVEAVDGVATVHKQQINTRDYGQSSSDSIAKEIMAGSEVASIHYLADGILKIRYAVSGDFYKVLGDPAIEMTVVGIDFYEDYVIPTANGEMTNHKIDATDLPTP